MIFFRIVSANWICIRQQEKLMISREERPSNRCAEMDLATSWGRFYLLLLLVSQT